MKTYEINKNERIPAVIDSLTCVWEESVRASHTFLTESDIANLKPFVREALAGIESLVVAHNGSTYTAFIGIQGNKIEMLFVSPAHFGEDIGKHLVNMAIQKYKTTHVDVNEQNPKATGFYKHLGFKTFRRDDTDDQGNPFPILRMKLN